MKIARLVIVESPFAAESEAGIAENIDYARTCLRDALQRGEAPYASHLLYTQPGVLNDRDPEERRVGMRAGFFVDRGLGRDRRLHRPWHLARDAGGDRAGSEGRQARRVPVSRLPPLRRGPRRADRARRPQPRQRVTLQVSPHLATRWVREDLDPIWQSGAVSLLTAKGRRTV